MEAGKNEQTVKAAEFPKKSYTNADGYAIIINVILCSFIRWYLERGAGYAKKDMVAADGRTSFGNGESDGLHIAQAGP